MMLKKDAIKKSITLENNSKVKSTLIKYATAIGVAGIIAVFILWMRDFWNVEELSLQYHYLSDAFTIPGVLFIMFGCLLALSNEGSLDAIGFMLKRCIQMLNPFSKKEVQKYADYVAGRKKVSGFAFLFFVGLLYLAIGVLFVILFYSVYSA